MLPPPAPDGWMLTVTVAERFGLPAALGCADMEADARAAVYALESLLPRTLSCPPLRRRRECAYVVR